MGFFFSTFLLFFGELLQGFAHEASYIKRGLLLFRLLRNAHMRIVSRVAALMSTPELRLASRHKRILRGT